MLHGPWTARHRHLARRVAGAGVALSAVGYVAGLLPAVRASDALARGAEVLLVLGLVLGVPASALARAPARRAGAGAQD